MYLESLEILETIVENFLPALNEMKNGGKMVEFFIKNHRILIMETSRILWIFWKDEIYLLEN